MVDVEGLELSFHEAHEFRSRHLTVLIPVHQKQQLTDLSFASDHSASARGKDGVRGGQSHDRYGEAQGEFSRFGHCSLQKPSNLSGIR